MSLERFLFAPVDPRSVRIFRALLALLAALVFWPAGRPLVGALARDPQLAELWGSLFLGPYWLAAALAALLAFGAGRGGRATGLAAVSLLLPLLFVRHSQARQLLWLALLACSLLPAGPAHGAAQAPPAGPIWPLRLVQIQLSVLYAVNAWAKLTPEFLRGEVLIGLSRVMPNFLVDLSDGSLHLGPLALPVWLCALGTLAVEAALAIGLWIPKLRIATIALGVAFHLSLRFVIQIGWLDWTCLFLYLAFLLPFERADTPRANALA